MRFRPQTAFREEVSPRPPSAIMRMMVKSPQHASSLPDQDTTGSDEDPQ